MTLIRKDWRVLRPAVIGCVVVSIGVYAIGIVPILSRTSGMTSVERTQRFLFVALLAAAVTGVFAAALGASSFAVERRDGAAEFLAMLPVSHWRILASKAVVALTFVLLALGAHVVAVVLGLRHVGWRDAVNYEYALAGIGSGSLMLFSVGWLFRVFMNGAAVPFGISLAITVASAEVLAQVIDGMALHGFTFVLVWLVWSATVALATGVFGWLLYARRVEP